MKVVEKVNRTYKLNLPAATITQNEKGSGIHKRDAMNDYLYSKTPQNEVYKSITDYPSDLEKDSQSRMPQLHLNPNRTVAKPYLFNTDETMDSPKRLSESRVRIILLLSLHNCVLL